MSRADSAPKFWRCGWCGTPNPTAGYVTHCLGCGALRPANPQPANATKLKSGGLLKRLWPKTPSLAKPKTTAKFKIKSEPETKSVRPFWKHWLGRLALVMAWAYAILMVALLMVIAFWGERWWPTTFLLFAPRWLMLFPLAPLLLMAVMAGRRSVAWPLLVGFGLVIGPWMGLCIPWQAAIQSQQAGQLKIRVATCNIEGGRASALPTLMSAMNPHIIMMQECTGSGSWRSRKFQQGGWTTHYQKGIGIATRFPLVAVEDRPLSASDLGGGHIVRFTVDTPQGLLDVFGLHLRTPRHGLTAVIEDGLDGTDSLDEENRMRWEEAKDAAKWAAESKRPFIIAGDFNMTVDSPIYQQHWVRLLNAFSASGLGYGHTKFNRFLGIRIDHILGGPGWIARRCGVGPHVGSDHRPIVADLEWSP